MMSPGPGSSRAEASAKGQRLFVVGVLVVILGVVVSIALHEVGHLVPAKLFGVKVTQYMVGFGRTLWSRQRGETEYGIKAIPLGGYVRMIGMYPPSRSRASAAPRAGVRGYFDALADEARAASAEEVPPGEEHRAFYALSVPKRLVVMVSGTVTNLLIAAVLFVAVLSGFGVPAQTSTLGSVAQCVIPIDEGERACTAADVAAPGAVAGLQAGDEVLSWGGQPVTDWRELSAAIRAGGTESVEVVVRRAGEDLALTVTPVLADRPVIEDGQYVTDDDGALVLAPSAFVGVGPTVERVRQPVTAGLSVTADAVVQTGAVVLTLPQRLVDVIQSSLGEGERDNEGVIGLIGVGRVAGELATGDTETYPLSARFANLLTIIASLNVALFVFNLLPLLPLDGGHAAGAAWEGIRRQVARIRRRPDPGPVDVARAMPLAYAVIVLMVAMTLVLAWADIVNPVAL